MHIKLLIQNNYTMKHLFTLLALTFLAGSAFAQEARYDDFKTGTFTYESQEGEVEIIRTKTKQIEIYNDGKSKLITNIKWENDSTYVLTHKKAINAEGCLDKGDWIRTKIISRDGNRYEADFVSNKCGRGTAIFIKLK